MAQQDEEVEDDVHMYVTHHICITECVCCTFYLYKKTKETK